MKLTINGQTHDWTIHPRPGGGDLVLTHENVVAVVDTYNKWAMIWGEGGEHERLRQSVVDKLLEAELTTTAKSYPLVVDLVPGKLFHIEWARWLGVESPSAAA